MPDGSANKVRRGRKFDQVLAGARDVFMADGFEGASVDDIARAAGVSKATLYSYFPDKRLLFMEVAKAECLRQADMAIETIDMTRDVRVVLCDIARHMVDFFTSDFSQRTFRICIAESDRFPELGREFYNNGPVLFRTHMTEFLDKAIELGDLKIEDTALASDQFAELCKADLFPRMMFNVSKSFSKDEKSRVVDGAVSMFMARYAT